MVISAAVPPSRPSTLHAPAAHARHPRTGWAGEMWRRVRHRPVLKALGISAFMWLFFVAYFYLLRHPARPVTLMPLTALDRTIAFQPGAFVAYASLWVYVGIAPGLMLSLREVLLYGVWIGGLCLVGLGCFYLWPTAVPRYDYSAAAAAHAGIALLQGVDAAGNACPSLHVASATFTAVWIHHLLRATGARRVVFVLNLGWLALIVYSTLAIKQHVVLDALAGVLLALLFAWPAWRCNPPAIRQPSASHPIAPRR